MKTKMKDLVRVKVARCLLDLLRAKELTARAACNETTAELFFSEEPAEMAQARQVCMACPVRQMCLEYFSIIENDGIAGGLTAAERRKARANAPVYAVEDVNEAISIQRDLATQNAEQFSQKYGLTERSYYRWKRDMRGEGLAS